ncbi:fused chemotaxis regulator; protein-glutamate methylesterase in two-component regulatory system with CheA [Candidatus Sulfotelmatomonas gaucii]|uniref:Protein-glutamate methylesterase/protein-glutamine glutaminase n=1 Tax=Candidatus Sulfuritelmatomonas gaucii TaxID=2043161 RepID=A0A2N9L9Y2_9BACT|nr:fused chemotaxis regulator; protein-glutamate methylesterase in two-component regulatory system with CheA [Candidatus Sulfotelmatomonas gaucii]
MAPARRTRILIVDDSAVMRSLLRSVIATDPAFEMAGTAADGASALNALALNSPDLVLLDVEMPVMDGLVTLRQLRERGHKIPVIMCSSLTQRGAKVTIEALAVGASDYVAKPSGQPGREAAVRALAQELIPKIHALTRASQPCAIDPLAPRLAPAGLAASVAGPVSSALPRVVAIGVSTGGPAVLDVLLPTLPADFPLPIVIVQHMPEVFTRLFAERLSRRCGLRVCEGSESEPVMPGAVYIARGNWHMQVIASTRTGKPATIHLNQDPPENHCRPAVDVLFRSVARVYGSGVVALVLTGMGSDGLAGCRLIRSQGGMVLAQDEATSIVWGMPGSVVQAGLAHKVLPLHSMAAEIVRIAGRSAKAETRSLAPMVA